MHAGICLPATYTAQHPLYSQFYTGSLHVCTFPGSVAGAEKKRIYSKKNNFKAFTLLLKGSVCGAVPLEPSTRGTCLIQLLLPTSYPACVYSPIACFLSQASSVQFRVLAQPSHFVFLLRLYLTILSGTQGTGTGDGDGIITGRDGCLHHRHHLDVSLGFLDNDCLAHSASEQQCPVL